MKKYLVIVVTVLLVSPSFGQIPTGPDELGIYFDEAGTSVSITADGTSDLCLSDFEKSFRYGEFGLLEGGC